MFHLHLPKIMPPAQTGSNQQSRFWMSTNVILRIGQQMSPMLCYCYTHWFVVVEPNDGRNRLTKLSTEVSRENVTLVTCKYVKSQTWPFSVWMGLGGQIRESNLIPVFTERWINIGSTKWILMTSPLRKVWSHWGGL